MTTDTDEKQLLLDFLEETASKTQRQRYHYEQEHSRGVSTRIGNELTIAFCNLDPLAFRMLTFVMDAINQHPLDALFDKKTIELSPSKEEVYFPEKYRVADVCANEYIRQFGLSEGSGHRQFVNDLISLMDFKCIEENGGLHTQSGYIQGPMLLNIFESLMFSVKEDTVHPSQMLTVKTVLDEDGKVIKETKTPKYSRLAHLTLTNTAAKSLFFLKDNFTVLPKQLGHHLTPRALKLYVYCAITYGKNNKKASVKVSENAESWMAFFEYKMCKSTTVHTIKQKISRIIAEINECDKCQYFLEAEVTKKKDLAPGQEQQMCILVSKKAATSTPKPQTKEPAKKLKAAAKPTKPKRERLPPYPNKTVMKNDVSDTKHDRIVYKWAIDCKRILEHYEKVLNDKGYKLPKSDRQKLIKYKDLSEMFPK